MDGFGPWSVKSGMVHVEPPFDLLAGMVTVRVHLDAVPKTNAPLLVAPGSHKRGRIPTAEIPEVVLHASDASSEPRHRRVLQIDYAGSQLPCGLGWLGV